MTDVKQLIGLQVRGTPMVLGHGGAWYTHGVGT